jgi:hypothetical protein
LLPDDLDKQGRGLRAARISEQLDARQLHLRACIRIRLEHPRDKGDGARRFRMHEILQGDEPHVLVSIRERILDDAPVARLGRQFDAHHACITRPVRLREIPHQTLQRLLGFLIFLLLLQSDTEPVKRGVNVRVPRPAGDESSEFFSCSHPVLVFEQRPRFAEKPCAAGRPRVVAGVAARFLRPAASHAHGDRQQQRDRKGESKTEHRPDAFTPSRATD